MGQRYYTGNASVREENGARVYIAPGPWSMGVLKVDGALCSDGVKRIAHLTAPADSFFSIPACVKVRGKTVSGYLTVNEVMWADICGPAGKVWRFHATRTNRKYLPATVCTWCAGTGNIIASDYRMNPEGNPEPCYDCARKEEH